MKIKVMSLGVIILIFIITLMGCTTSQNNDEGTVFDQGTNSKEPFTEGLNPQGSLSGNILSFDDSIFNITELFTNRDLQQTAELNNAVNMNLKSGEDIKIVTGGVYVLKGSVENVTVLVQVDDESKVQIVLDSVSITNEDAPAIYVKSGDKVFITSTDSENYMKVSGSYQTDGDTNLDAVVFSKSDLTLNGMGTLEIISSRGNGITSKDDLKITGGKYNITSKLDALEANDSICMYDGDINIVTEKDAFHSENDEDTSLGYIYIIDGTININAEDDAIRGNSIVKIDGGTINIETCTEGIEGTYVQINGGDINIYSTDDGINATNKSDYSVVIEVNDGNIDVKMGSGDTDAFDSNGNIYINGGTINIEGNSSFDSDGTSELNGGDVTVNGEKITEITESQMGPMGGKGRR